MLDDLKMIHQRDSQDALGVAEKQWQQFQHSFGFSWSPPRPVHDVIVAGMGGSGLAAKARKTTGDLHVPYEVIQDYELPEYVHENTLLICLSYSGNTEETLSIFDQAVNREDYPKPMVVTISSGGKLLKQAKDKKLPFIQLPSGYQPRHTFGYQYRALAEVFSATPLVDGEISLIETAAKQLKTAVQAWLPTVPAKNNRAKQIAKEVIGKSVVIYAGPVLSPAAYKWKISFNENAKHIAWCGQLPEFDHNEILGWTEQPVDKPYTILDLRSSLDNERINKRFKIGEKLLSGMRPHPIIVEAEGKTSLEQLIWTVAFGDFVTIYTALLNGLDPTPVKLIEKLKHELAN